MTNIGTNQRMLNFFLFNFYNITGIIHWPKHFLEVRHSRYKKLSKKAGSLKKAAVTRLTQTIFQNQK
jgi:hypothetical protein